MLVQKFKGLRQGEPSYIYFFFTTVMGMLSKMASPLNMLKGFEVWDVGVK